MPESVGQPEASQWERNSDSANNPQLPAESLELEMLARASKLVLRRNEPHYELANVLEEIMDGLKALVPYEGGTIHRLDPKDDQLRAIIVRGKDAETFVEQLIPLHSSLIGHALLTRQPYIYNNLLEHPKLHILQGNTLTLAGLLIAPLALDPLGGGWVICIRRFETPNFSERDFQLFKIFANYADAAIQNTQLYQAAIRDAKTLREVNEIMQAVSAVLEPYEVCQRMAAGVGSMLEYERLAVLMIDLNKETVRCEFNTQNPGHLTEIISPLRGSVIEYVNRTGKTFVRQDTAGTGIQFFPEDTQLLKDLVRSYMIIPLRTESELNGVIMLTSYWPAAFDETSINFMQILTVQFATVMQNALLFERLSRTKHEWKLTLDAIPDAMMLVDATDLSILQANFGAANMVGNHPDELIGRTCREVFYAVDPGLADFPLEELKPEVSGYSEEKTGTTSGRIYQRSIYPIFGSDKQLSELVVHIRDITENKLLTQQLAENARLKAVGEMASGIAHDFNNSLTGILGNVELMLVEVTDPALQKQLKQLKQAALDSADTVKRIQSFGKRDGKLAFQSFDLSEAAREVIELTRPRWQNQSAQKGIYIGVVQKLSNKVEVWGSAAEIKEVITNLLFNAIDALPNGGTVTISSGIEKIGRGSKMGEMGVLEVSDTGQGISPEVRDHIFEAFFTTKGKNGTGLGLARVHTVVTEHEGEVSFDSRPGEGTNFFVRLQLAANYTKNNTPVLGTPSFKPPETTEKTTPPQSHNILVIDDDPALAGIMQRILQLQGHKVTRAGSGAQGLELFRQNEKFFDMVFTDLSMPEMSGYEVAKAIKAADQRVVVAFITGWGNELSLETLEGRGVDLFISKPYRLDEVVNMVKKAVEIRHNYLNNNSPT